ncbi:MAG: OmpA family protein [Candidatus Dadabacteria bacterium]|jgi:peptidoglycan-associated lipoprotein|nr:OmpA family protein [Candidatus Dadabacteria bacterium]MCZ6555553.1 OmpA family protein [Candidatus Dadabacteria bacterium]
MKRDKQMLFLSIPFLVVALLYLASCATPPPTKELAAADSSVADATATCEQCKSRVCGDDPTRGEYCGAPCGEAELAAANSALSRGKALAGEFCSELEARRMLIDAKAKADEAKLICSAPPPPPPPPIPVTDLKDIFFDFDKSNIRTDAGAVLGENAEILMVDANVTVLIEGYADIRGTPAYNLQLAQRRADAAKAFLVGLGIDPSRITTASGGETTQFGAGTTEEAYQLNRRAHFIGTSPSAKVGARLIFSYAK